MKTGDICLYKPQKGSDSKFKHIIFVMCKGEKFLHQDTQYWCGWLDYDNIWREGLIPENYLEIIND